MKLSDALTADRIVLNLSSKDKASAIQELLEVMDRSVPLPNPERLLPMILNQERVKSSGVNRGVAIPHTRSDEIKNVVIALGISRDGIDFQGLDGALAQLIFLVLSSAATTPAYLSVLSRTARIFSKEGMRQQVLGAASAEAIVDLIREQEPV